MGFLASWFGSKAGKWAIIISILIGIVGYIGFLKYNIAQLRSTVMEQQLSLNIYENNQKLLQDAIDKQNTALSIAKEQSQTAIKQKDKLTQKLAEQQQQTTTTIQQILSSKKPTTCKDSISLLRNSKEELKWSK